MTAGIEKIFHPDPRIGFLAHAADPKTAQAQVFNDRLDAAVAALFLALVATVVVSALIEWARILGGGRPLETEVPDAPGSHGPADAPGAIDPAAVARPHRPRRRSRPLALLLRGAAPRTSFPRA